MTGSARDHPGSVHAANNLFTRRQRRGPRTLLLRPRAHAASELCGRGPMGRPQRGQLGTGSLDRRPARDELRRSVCTLRSAPIWGGKSRRHSPALARMASILSAGRTARRVGPSYSRTCPGRSAAFQYSHRYGSLRQTMASRRGTSTAVGFLAPPITAEVARILPR